jgi:hypothetical protein
MILFLEDWKKFPRAIPDYSTKQRTFFEMSVILRDMGIKNHLFPLALLNPELQGVDPFDYKNLTVEQMAMIALECKLNPWYYFREIAMVPGGSGEEAVHLMANRGNIALYWCFFNHITTFLIQIRQTGKSVSVDELAVYLLEIRCYKTDINLLTKDEGLRVANIKRLKEIDDELPIYLKRRGKNDANNTELITVNALSNRLLTHLPQASPKLANNVGRGFTSPITFVDEGPFQPNIHIAVPAALAAGTAARERAARAGDPYGNIFTTTAGKKDEVGGEFIYNILTNDCAQWTERLLDAQNAQVLEAMVRGLSATKKFYVNITMNHKQLGKDDEWLARAIENTAGITAEQADRDFFNRWTSGSLTSPLSTADLERIRLSEKSIVSLEISEVNQYATRWYIPKEQIEARMASGKYLICMDPSEAIGQDDISMNLMDVRTGENIAAGTFNETMTLQIAHWIAELMIKWPNTIAMIERRSSGVAIIEHLLLILPSRGIDPFKRIFNRIVNDSDEEPERYAEIQTPLGRRPSDIYSRYKKHFGFATSGSGITARSNLYSVVLQNAAKQIGDRVYDKRTIDQITSLIIRNGRVDHPVGGHDDHVIAWLLGYWLLTQGKNLSYYGIDVNEILVMTKPQRSTNYHESYQDREQRELREQMNVVMEKLKQESDLFLVTKLEQQLRWIDSKLIKTTEVAGTVEELIQNTREEKRKTRARAGTQNYGWGNNNNLFQRFNNPALMSPQNSDPTVLSIRLK